MSLAQRPWISGPLGRFMPLQRGFDLPTQSIVLGPFPVVYSNGVGNYHITAMAKGPGVVTGRSGTIGRIHYVEGDYWPHNTALWVTDFKHCHPKFTYYYLQHVALERFAGGSGVPTLNRNDAHSYEITIPGSLKEQRRIASVLTDADDLLAALERLIAKTRAIKQGLMQQLLTGQIRLPGFTDRWRHVLLGDHVNYVRTAALSRAQLNATSPLRYLHYGEIHTYPGVHLDAAAEPLPRAPLELAGRAGWLQPGDVVFADASEDTAGVGKSVEITTVPPEGLVPGLHTIAARFDRDVLADDFKAYLQFIPIFRQALMRLAAGTKVLATTRSYISSISLPLPTVEEQKAIANVLIAADREIASLRRRTAKAKNVREGMMQELLTGRTRLPIMETAA